jgi:hypothetical protein
MKNQTAVEWLLKQITYDNGFGQRLASFKETVDLNEYFQQAKAMEREQISEAFLDGAYRSSPSDLDYENFKETGEQYYAQNFL